MSAAWPHGTSTGYDRRKCRCEHCIAYSRARGARHRLKHGMEPRVLKLPPELFLSDLTDPRHGTNNGYNNLGCRCARCREAHTEERNRRIARLSQRPVPEGQHGTHIAYDLYRCRCDICATWRRAYVRDYEARAARSHRN